ncbi:hypothetical protein EXE59_09805 [Nocardioides eburneiflavus]|uniref:Uncharacterized protein n=1 Tax=Nocardioides eburneiflavus TaxID=2518372 RepID=A0A4Z1CJM2_9ACTN|nr:hypothetical protein [Nocardioides eburneiflavus]TGN64213.1 hypothetical protein EXE59_09805 [Nocardioides eburneiflavus]
MLMVIEAPVEHDGSPDTWADPAYVVTGSWTHDQEGEPVTVLAIADGNMGMRVWRDTRPGHLSPEVVLDVAAHHLPPAPSWAGFGRRDPDPVEAAVAGDTTVRVKAPLTGAEMDVQMRVLTGRVAPFGRGALDLSALDVSDAMRDEARHLVRQAFRSGGLAEVERLRDDLMHRAHLALNHCADWRAQEGPGHPALRVAPLTRHLQRAATNLIAEYHSY